MADILAAIQRLIDLREVQISRHGYRELVADDITIAQVIEGVDAAVVVESYPDAPKGPSVLVLQRDAQGAPLHVVWGIPKGMVTPAVLITAYRPDPTRWSSDFMKRKTP